MEENPVSFGQLLATMADTVFAFTSAQTEMVLLEKELSGWRSGLAAG